MNSTKDAVAVVARALKESEYDTCMFSEDSCKGLAAEIILALLCNGYEVYKDEQ